MSGPRDLRAVRRATSPSVRSRSRTRGCWSSPPAPGSSPRGLVEALPDAEITATDLNDAMVTYAADRVPSPPWQVADAQDLPFADESFDLVVCQFGVMFLPDRIGAYRGVRRVLAPGGSFLFNVWDTLETHEVEAAVIDAVAELFPDDPPDFLRAGPARVRRPAPDPRRRPGRRVHRRRPGPGRAGGPGPVRGGARRGLLPRHAPALRAPGARRARRPGAAGGLGVDPIARRRSRRGPDGGVRRPRATSRG